MALLLYEFSKFNGIINFYSDKIDTRIKRTGVDVNSIYQSSPVNNHSCRIYNIKS